MTSSPFIRARRFAAALSTITVGAVAALGPAPSAGATAPEAASQYASGFVIHTTSADTGWSTTGSKPVVTRQSTGGWKVRFPGFLGDFGVPTVSPVPGVAAITCNIDGVASLSNAIEIGVRCHKPGGAAVDGAFALSYTSAPGAQAWATHHQPLAADKYTPQHTYSWIGKPVWAFGLNQLGWQATQFEGLATMAHATLLSPMGGAARACHVVQDAVVGNDRWVGFGCAPAGTTTPTPTSATVHLVGTKLFAGTGGRDAHIVLSQAGPYLFPDVTYLGPGTSLGAITRFSKGISTITIIGGATPGPGLAHVSTSQAGHRCNANAKDQGANEVITVRCWNAAGAPTDSSPTIVYFGAP